MDKYVKTAAVPDKTTEEYIEAGVLPGGDSSADYENVGTMDEYIGVSAVPDQQNK